MAGCFLISGAIGVVLAIAGIVALYAGVEWVTHWITDVVGDHALSVILGGTFLIGGILFTVAILRRGPTAEVGLRQWLIALVATGGMVLVGVFLLVLEFSSGSPGF